MKKLKLENMRILMICMLTLLFSNISSAQYEFTHTQDIACTKVKSQARTGTCWSFATASFIETEMMRKGFSDLNLSEMFVVRNIYADKARNYMLRQGKANFSQGSLSHDLLRIMGKNGIVTEEAYSGLMPGDKSHDHSEMEAGLKGFLDGVMKSKRLSKKWPVAFEAILDSYMGELPKTFEYDGKTYTAESFADHLGFNAKDYKYLTSFSHHDFYESFILEIPDNYSNKSYYNLPIDNLVDMVDNAIEKGYSIAWDGDVSEKGFNAGKGIAVLPTDSGREDLFENPGEELEVDQQTRQDNFESYATTDDHLMHIVGKATDQNGTEYYIIKNSWGEISPYKGFLYMSKPYFKMKTVAVVLHKDAVSQERSE